MLRPRGRWWWVAALGVAVVLSYAVRKADPDLWGHVRYGQLWLTEGVVTHDPFAYTTAGRTWIGHEIGAEIVSWWAYAWAGQVGLCVLKTAAGVTVAMLMWWALPARVRRTWLGLTIWLVAVHTVALFLVVRPQLFTYVFTAATALILFRHTLRPTRAVWCLPVLSVVWTNCHGGYVVLLGLVGLYLVGPWLYGFVGWWHGRRTSRAGPRAASPSCVAPCAVHDPEADPGIAVDDGPAAPRASTLAWVLAACVVGTFVNPYGPKIWACLYNALTNPYTHDVIAEWRPIELFRATRQEMLFLMLALGLVVAMWGGVAWRRLAGGRNTQRTDAAGVVVCVVMAIMAIRSYRHIPLFAIVSAPWLLRWGHTAWLALATRNAARARLFGPAVTLAALASLLPTLIPTLADPRPRLAHLKAMPVGAVRFMQNERISGNVYNPFGWGQYLIAHLYPQCRVAMDGRYDTVYAEREYVSNFAFIRNGDIGHAVEPPTDYILLAANGAANAALAAHGGWTAIYEDDISRLWARTQPLTDGPRYTASRGSRYAASRRLGPLHDAGFP